MKDNCNLTSTSTYKKLTYQTISSFQNILGLRIRKESFFLLCKNVIGYLPLG
ncbi:MAG TPA: hypothetical protein VJ772_10685 [Nitrososphaeraceae archaeon]|nr:hypothetical protein [Nitrososphaeraceae archaeon]